MLLFSLLLTFCVHIQALPAQNFCKRNVGFFRKQHLSALQNNGVLFKIVSYDQAELEIKNSTPVGRYFPSSQLNIQMIFYEIEPASNPEKYQLEVGSYKTAYSAEAFLISNIKQNDFTLPNNLACAFKGENLKVYIYKDKDPGLGSNIVLFGACRLHKVRSAVITEKSLIILVYNYIEVNESGIIKLIQSKINKLSVETFKSVDDNYEGFCGCRQVSFYIEECTSISEEPNYIFWILVAVLSTFGLSWIIKACYTWFRKLNREIPCLFLGLF